jgi:hypothetical protein
VITGHRLRLALLAASWAAFVIGLGWIVSGQVASCLGSPFNPEALRECAEAPQQLGATIASPLVIGAGWLLIAAVDAVEHHWW